MVEIEAGDTLPAANASSMARVRVYTRTRSGGRVAMLGLVPRSALDQVKARFVEAARVAPGRCRLAARVQQIDAVLIEPEPGAAPVPARRVVLGFSVEQGPATPSPRARILQRELDELVALADRIKDASPVAAGTASAPGSAP